jgi:hypothetical protein
MNTNEKIYVLIVNQNKICVEIIKNLITQGYKIVLVAYKLEYYTDRLFDVWDQLIQVYDINCGEDEWEEKLISFLSHYKNDTIVNLTPIDNDKFDHNTKILHVLKRANINNIVLINHFHYDKKNKDNYDVQVYRQYLYEILMPIYFKKYCIYRIGGDVIDKEELLKIIKTMMNNQIKVSYPNLYRYKILNDVIPNINSVNILYNDSILRKNDLYLRTNQNQTELVKFQILKFLFAGVIFKSLSRFIFICIKKN